MIFWKFSLSKVGSRKNKNLSTFSKYKFRKHDSHDGKFYPNTLKACVFDLLHLLLMSKNIFWKGKNEKRKKKKKMISAFPMGIYLNLLQPMVELVVCCRFWGGFPSPGSPPSGILMFGFFFIISWILVFMVEKQDSREKDTQNIMANILKLYSSNMNG